MIVLCAQPFTLTFALLESGLLNVAEPKSSETRAEEKPLVSVIIPAYEASAYICDALNSVFSQSYRNFEVILVNDGSPDTQQLERVLHPYIDRIVYLKQPNGGPSAARNAAIRRAQGEYLAFLDSDDAWYPDYLASQIEFALSAQPPYDLVYADQLLLRDLARADDAERRGIRYSETCPSNGDVTFVSLVSEQCQAPTTCTIIRRQIAIDAGLFDENFRRAEDYDLWLRVAHRGAAMAFQRKVVAKHRLRKDSLSSDNAAMLEGMANVLAKLDDCLALSEPERSVLRRKLLDTSAELALERGKAKLIDGEYEEATALLSEANSIRKELRLRCVMRCIEIAPRFTRFVVGLWMKRPHLHSSDQKRAEVARSLRTPG